MNDSQQQQKCSWCGLPVMSHPDIDGNHRDLFGCKAALMHRVKVLEHDNAEKDKIIAAYQRGQNVRVAE
jgi:hypothetical protein